MMLNALSGISSLTSLQLDFTWVKDWYDGPQAAAYSSDDDDDDDDDDHRYPQSAENDRLAEHLSRLTQLRKLSLTWPHETRNPLWRPLSNLAQLSALTLTCWELGGLSRRNSPFMLPQGPTSLQKLELISTPDSSATSHWLQPYSADLDMQPLECLHNLKLLTELRAPASLLDSTAEEPHFHINDNAVPQMRRDLPDSVEVLELGYAGSYGVQELLRLPQLCALSFQAAAHLTGWQLLLLEGMRGLTSLQLNYSSRL
jgi:hypothetical protein